MSKAIKIKWNIDEMRKGLFNGSFLLSISEK